MDAARAAAAATANIIVNKQLTAAESVVAQTASLLELMRKLASQAHVVADKASGASDFQIDCCINPPFRSSPPPPSSTLYWRCSNQRDAILR